jgi:hypothetical protein
MHEPLGSAGEQQQQEQLGVPHTRTYWKEDVGQ